MNTIKLFKTSRIDFNSGDKHVYVLTSSSLVQVESDVLVNVSSINLSFVTA